MNDSIGSRFKKAWNIFFNKDPTDIYRRDWGEAFYSRPDRPRLTGGNERSIITAIYNRIALDVASIDFRHVVLDDQGRYMKDRNSPLNDCLTLRATEGSELFLTVDGDEVFPLRADEQLQVSLSADHCVSMISLPHFDYYDLLHEKLMWGWNPVTERRGRRA